MPVVPNRAPVYVALLAMALAVALVAAWTPLGTQIDRYAYDWMFRIYRPAPWQTQSILLAIDEPSLSAFGGIPGLRSALAEGLERIAPAAPKAVAVDVLLAYAIISDAPLEAAFARHYLVWRDLLPDGGGGTTRSRSGGALRCGPCVPIDADAVGSGCRWRSRDVTGLGAGAQHSA
jgi:hypothetical protein